MENRVYLAPCDGYEEEKVKKSVHDIIEAFGGAAALAGGKRVLVKANLLMSSTPDKAVTTHPLVIAAIASEFVAAGCTVEIADSCGGIYQRGVLEKLYAVCGMRRAAEQSGATLNFETSSEEKIFKDGVLLKKASVIAPVSRADFIVSAAKLKTHGFAYYTGAVKNMYGVIPGLDKAILHSRYKERDTFCEMIVDLCEGIAPDLSIIDGVVGMEGKGPSGGVPKRANVLIGAKSPYAADLAGINVMGLDAAKSQVHVIAARRGLVPLSAEELSYIGAPAEDFRESFEPPYKSDPRRVIQIFPSAARAYVERALATYPLVDEKKCIGCGACARSCPEKTIDTGSGKARIGYKKCIRCYCCHELCPVKAIELKRFAKYRRR